MNPGSPVLPNFLIVGAPRSGTTALARYLGAHPEVFMAGVKEIRFFDERHDRGTGWYAAHFAAGAGRARIGEATPTYMYVPEAIERMAELLPEAKLLAVLRNPVDRAYSQYWLARSLGTETRSFEASVGLAPDPEPGGRVRSFVDRGVYVPRLAGLAERFPRAAIHVEIFEELVADPAGRFAAVCRFLGIDPSVRPQLLGSTVNPHVAYRSVTLRRRARSAPGPLKAIVDRLNVRRETYPPMSPRTRAELVERFREPNRELASWLGRAVEFWDR